MSSIKKGDIIIICMIIIITVFGQYYLITQETGGQLRTIVLRVDQEEHVYKLSVDESRKIIFEFNEHLGTLHYKEGRIKMETMDRVVCPKQICSKTGWIKYSNQSIVCLPNKIIVTIVNEKDNDLDTITF